MECGVETVGHEAGFLLDRIRRRPRPRNRQTRKSLCQPRIEESVLDLGANGSGRIDNEVGHVTAGASSTATRGIARPSSQEQSHHQEARAICAPGCGLFNHRQRFATTGTAASPAAAFDSGVGFIQRRRRHGDHGMSGNPAASCAIRLGSEARISRFRSAHALPHSAISPSERPQSVQRSAPSAPDTRSAYYNKDHKESPNWFEMSLPRQALPAKVSNALLG